MKKEKKIVIRLVVFGILAMSAGLFALFYVAKTLAQRIFFLVYIAILIYIEVCWFKKLKNKRDKSKR